MTMETPTIMGAVNIGGIIIGAIDTKIETRAIIETTIIDYYHHYDCQIWNLYNILFFHCKKQNFELMVMLTKLSFYSE
jgi:hypothetical protein